MESRTGNTRKLVVWTPEPELYTPSNKVAKSDGKRWLQIGQLGDGGMRNGAF